ncbi:hypothetical protein JCM8547_003604 [Rhodosporidiobolus lusitaniae]
MKAITLEEFISLPAAYGIEPSTANYVDFYGPEMRQAYMQAYVVFAYNSYYVANIFNHVTYGLTGLILLTALSMRLFNAYAAGRSLPAWLIRLRTFWAKHFTRASVFGGKASEPYNIFGLKFASVQVPTRVHSVIVGLYVAWNFIVAFSWYKELTPNLWYQDIDYYFDFLLRGFADRTGIIAIAATPLVIALAGRNSPIAAMTGASYATLQIYHRWVSRVAVMHAIFHSIGYSLLEGLYGTAQYREEFKYDYWNWGVAATVGGSFLVFGSFRRLRELCYEAFLLLHIASAIVWVVGCYYHVFLLDPEYSYLKYIYGAIAFWGFDRLVRWLRLAYLNFSLSGSKHGGVKRTPLAAEGYLTECGDFVRLRITMARSWPRKAGGAGKYVFISSPTVKGLSVLENHPFTITWPTGMPAVEGSTPSTPTSRTDSSSSPTEKKEFPFSSGSINDKTTWSEQSAEENSASFELVLRKYSGFTGQLAKKLGKDGNGVEKVKILVEGPYGEGVELSHLGAILLVAGGSGIAASTAHLAELATAMHEGKLKTKRVILVWAIRRLDTVHILLPYLHRLQSLLPPAFLTLHLYHTGAPDSLKDDNSALLALFHPVSRLLAARVELHSGRPWLPQHVDELAPGVVSGTGEKDVGGGKGGSLKAAVSSCGPAGMVDSAREAVRSRLGHDGWTTENLDFHDEVFTW